MKDGISHGGAGLATMDEADPAPRRSSAPLARSLRVVLIQIRGQPQAERHERWCVREATGLDQDQLLCWNVVAKPRISWDMLRGADALVIGGSGDHSVLEDYPFLPWVTDTVRAAVAAGQPIFGICWGHQCLAQALGGRVIDDREREEIGTYDVELTDAGLADPLFADLPPRFATHLVHHCRIVEPPPGAVELARNDLCPWQAMRLAGQPIYGTQFHGEMTREQLKRRLLMYQDEYLESEDQVREVVASLRPTHEARTLLRRFLELYAS